MRKLKFLKVRNGMSYNVSKSASIRGPFYHNMVSEFFKQHDHQRMDQIGIPQPQMQWDKPTQGVEKFSQHMEVIFEGPLAEKKEKQKIWYLLLRAVGKGRDVYNTWALIEYEGKSLEVHLTKFQEYV